LSGKEEKSAIDSECEENDVIAKQIDDTGQLVSENDENPTTDVIDGTQCSSAQRKNLVNVTVDGSGNNVRESGRSDEGRNTESAAVLDNSENTPHYNNSSVQRSSAPTRSPLAELLVYPTPTQKTSKNRSCCRVLTSSESIAMLEEKARKKREEQEEKERKRKDRELKKAAKEEQKRQKVQERQAKQAEKQKKAEEKRAGGQKRSSASNASKSKQQRVDVSNDDSQDNGLQHHEISKDECAACFGLFEDDPDSVEWIECTNESCKVWCHADCLERCDEAYVCVVCQTLLA